MTTRTPHSGPFGLYGAGLERSMKTGMGNTATATAAAPSHEWTDEMRAELEQLVDREISTLRSRIPHEQLVRQRFSAPAA